LLPGDGALSSSGSGGVTTIRRDGTGGAGGRRDATAGPVVRDADGTVDAGGDSNDAGIDTIADARRDATGDAATVKPRVLSLVLRGAPWYATQATQGIAVDELNRVYVGDSANVFVVDGTSLRTYLTTADAPNPTGAPTGFGDFDIGPDGRLYIVSSAFLAGTGWSVGVVRSSVAHQAEPWVDLSELTQPRQLAVIGDGFAGVVSREGFWTFVDGGGQLVYDAGKGVATFGCAAEDLAAAPSGVFLFQPGCNASPILRGRSNGSDVATLYNTTVLQPSSPIPAENFTCVARDPTGGFYVVIAVYDNGGDAPVLYHVAENANGTDGLTLVPTVPSFADAKRTQNDSVFGFLYCSIAAGRDGAVYYQTYGQLWKVSP
jgi:hypothetical protein